MRSSVEFAKKTLGKDLIVAEIGVDKGEHAKDILENWDEIKVLHLIDNYALDWNNSIYTEAVKNTQKFSHKIQWHRAKSKELIPIFPRRFFDFVYIDADHTYDEFVRDVLNFIPKIKKGGIIAGHDCCPWYYGVLEAIIQFKKIGWDIHTDVEDQDVPKKFHLYSDWWMVV